MSKTKLDRAHDDSFFYNSNGETLPFVCLLCDKNLKVKEVRYVKKETIVAGIALLKPRRSLHEDVLKYYTYRGPGGIGLEEALLSPKGCYVEVGRRRGKFVLCVKCYIAFVCKTCLPEFAIANYMEIGVPPDVIAELTDVELAFITDVRVHSHVLSFRGGHKGIIGWHSLIKTNIDVKRRALESLDYIECVPNKIVLIMTGSMTTEQKSVVMKHSQVRRDKCKEAIDWLLKNHSYYKDYGETIDLDNLLDPIIIDNTKEIESINKNLEMQEEVRIAFPDATLNEYTGGYRSIAELKSIVDSMVGGSVEASLNIPNSEYVRDYEGQNFMISFLRQYPYGYGGLHEIREQMNGSLRVSFKDDYIKHVTSLSNKHFAEALFMLVCYNVFHRQKMLQSASWRVKSSGSSNVASLTSEQVQEEINFRNTETYDSRDSRSAEKFVNMVTCMTRGLPHTDLASKKGRADVFSMQVAFGSPHVFLTLSPPDDNSIIIYVYSGSRIEEILPDVITEEYLKDRYKKRSAMRFRYPGLSTFSFEVFLDIFLKEVVGWDNDTIGYFGKPKAYFFAVEEQSRKSLHVHFLLWLTSDPYHVQELTKGEGTEREREALKRDAIRFINRTQSCELHGDSLEGLVHTCPSTKRKSIPAVQSDQMLRFLRHEEGCKALEGGIVVCHTCDKRWTSNELALNDSCIESYGFNISLETEVSTNSTRSCKSKEKLNMLAAEEIIFRSKMRAYDGKDTTYLVNALYNTHSSKHVRTCFAKKSPECRYKFPKKSNKRTRIEISETAYDWYRHHGEVKKQRTMEIELMRGTYDVCTNTYCPVISQSKCCGNSNVSGVVSPSGAYYISKYFSKCTQDEDCSDYNLMAKFTNSRLSLQKFDNTDSEAISRVVGACLAHNSKNVISATMAKYLIDHLSRFGKSHEIQRVPLCEMERLLYARRIMLRLTHSANDEEITNQRSNCNLFLESSSLHYLYRPEPLKDLASIDFFSKFQVRKIWGKKPKLNDGTFSFPECHPGHEYQILKRRKTPCIPGINNWYFDDAAKLSGDLLNKNTVIGKFEETYAFKVMLLCVPFCTLSDLKSNGSFVQKYREVYSSHIEPHAGLLQNIQDIYNVERVERTQDSLEKQTVSYVHTNTAMIRKDDQDDNASDIEDLEDYQTVYIRQLIDNSNRFDPSRLNEPIDLTAHRNDNTKNTFLSFLHIRNKGSNKCGYSLLKPLLFNGDYAENFVQGSSLTDNLNGDANPICDSNEESSYKNKITITDFVTLTLTNTTRRVLDSGEETFDYIDRYIENNVSYVSPESLDTQGSFISNESLIQQSSLEIKEYDVPVANGSAASVVNWSRKITRRGNKLTTFDKDQRKAFIMIISHFLLTYVEEAENNCETYTSIGGASRNRYLFKKEKRMLQKLGGERDKLRLFLDGPGGSGKSELIKQILRYAKEYCTLIKVPFTKDTILLTATTGVAATLIRGNTLHKECHLEKSIIAQEHIDQFENVRLIILDEVSMLKGVTLQKLDRKLRDLSDIGSFYGGKNIVFAGDFRQLEPIPASAAIYNNMSDPEWCAAMNTYIRLRGQYRFSKDPDWGEILKRFHDGCPLETDFEKINMRVVNREGTHTLDGDLVPPGIPYATPKNKERDSINTGLFNERVKQSKQNCLIVLAAQLMIKNLKGNGAPMIPLQDLNSFYTTCSEDDCKFPPRTSLRMDPVLKLYRGCPVMLTENTNVAAGIANGTEATVSKIVLKKDTTPFQIHLDDGNKVDAVYADQVLEIHLQHSNIYNIIDKNFVLKPRKFTFSARLTPPPSLHSRSPRFTRKMTAVQLPVISNSVTTGHKLQGSSRDNILIDNFAYTSNWPYVVLSRVTTIKGLFLRKPLDPTKDYSWSWQLSAMIRQFTESISVSDQYLQHIDDTIQ